MKISPQVPRTCDMYTADLQNRGGFSGRTEKLPIFGGVHHVANCNGLLHQRNVFVTTRFKKRSATIICITHLIACIELYCIAHLPRKEKKALIFSAPTYIIVLD